VPYNPASSGGSNLGPSNPALLDAVKARVRALHAADPGNSQPIPVDLITASGSGLDPDISIAAAYYQVPRIARERNLSEDILRSLVAQLVEHRQFGILGEPRVNVLSLNLALNDLSAGRITVSPSPSLPAQTVEGTGATVLGLRWIDWAQLILFAVILAAIVVPVGRFMAKTYRGEPTFLSPVMDPVERWILLHSGVDAHEEMDWKTFAAALMIFTVPCILTPFALQIVQGYLPLNPLGFGPVPWDLSLNTAVSFATNTNWQAYIPETTVSHLTQMAGLAVQNFLSAAAGMAVLIALVLALSRRPGPTIGNFWVLLTRSVLILLPMAGIIALLLVSQGVVQAFAGPVSVPLLDPFRDSSGSMVTTQTIPLGPAASQVAIKMLGTNGGGFFNANSAHPLENPTPFSNLVEMLSMILLPASLCYTFGSMVGSARRGIALLIAMTLLFLPLAGLAIGSEVGGNPGFASLGIDQGLGHGHPGGNMEGKEVRFGAVQSAFFSVLTTSISCGAVNSMHDSFMPLGGFAQLLAMQLGEVVYGGVGSGLYGMLVFAIIAMFIAGLMVGRTPEYLGKKIEPREMKLATVIIILPILLILGGTALAVLMEAGRAAVFNPGPHGFSEILYAFTSASQNNGSAFAGIMANTLFYNIATAVAMLIGRYAIAILTIALAGSLALKKIIPESEGTLRDHSLLFILWLAFVILVIGALSFLPVLSLGPIAEFLTLGGGG
jgi:K+-transporting ATPase ATPase A chain